MAITINASILDAIDRVLFLIEYQKEVTTKTKTMGYDLEETSAADVKAILLQNDINCCSFSDNHLYVTIALSAEEIAAEIEDLQSCAKYWAKRLVKWSLSSEVYKEQIRLYLEKHSEKYLAVSALMNNLK